MRKEMKIISLSFRKKKNISSDSLWVRTRMEANERNSNNDKAMAAEQSRARKKRSKPVPA